VTHVRQQIREAFTTAVTGLTTTGARVYSNRVYPSGADAIPGLTVRTESDALTDQQTIGDREQRELTLIVEARCKPASGGGDVDDVLDTICEEVETALMEDRSLGNRVRWMELQRTQFAFAGDLERPTGVASMVWTMRYYLIASDPSTLIYLA
jgi:hypothetical protein